MSSGADDLPQRALAAGEARHYVGRMTWVVSLVAMLAVLFLVSRGMPLSRWPAIIAVTLAVILLVVLAEQNGLWPASWRVR